MVYVQDREGKPLMPTERYGKVRRLLDCGRAKVVCRCPFTIRLAYDTPGYVQRVTLGVDAGSQHIGLSATTEQKELYAGQCDLRTDVTELLATRLELRRTRRGRKTRYRPARFDNRKKGEGWLAPSIRCKVEGHLRIVAKLHKILPISRIVVEVAQFDVQKIKNPDIAGTGYQHGEQYDSWNVREYVLARDGHVCQHCHGKSKDKVLEVHHIESRKTGGDAPNNQITLCRTCHEDYHAGKIKLSVRRGQPYRDAVAMNIMRWAVYNALKEQYADVGLTYGYITKCRRIENGIAKTHVADAYCIAGNLKARRIGEIQRSRFVRRHNRTLHRCKTLKGGIRKAAQTARVVRGFCHLDEIRCQGHQYWVSGRRTNGSFKVVGFDGECIRDGVNWKRIGRIRSVGTMLTNRLNVVEEDLESNAGAFGINWEETQTKETVG